MQADSEFELPAPVVNVLTARRRGGSESVIELDWNGHRFEAAGDLAGSGERVAVSVRPACVQLVDASAPNAAAGDVVEIVGVGDGSRLAIAVGDEIIWAMSPKDRIEPGAAVGVRFQPHTVAAFPTAA